MDGGLIMVNGFLVEAKRESWFGLEQPPKHEGLWVHRQWRMKVRAELRRAIELMAQTGSIKRFDRHLL